MNCSIRVSFTLNTGQARGRSKLPVGYLTCSARQMLFQSPIKETLPEAVLRCSSKHLLINSYSRFIGKCPPCRRSMLEKVARKTELEAVSELFCVEDSKSNHEQKQATQRKSVCYAKDIILCCSYFILFELGF